MKHSYKQTIDALLEKRLGSFSSASPVDAACLYAIRGGGRIRPLIIQTIAKSLGNPFSASIDNAALSIELLHSASLIADDFPCMDDDRQRRGQSACHIAHGEEVALLASYKLIALAYHMLSDIDPLLPLERHLLGLKTLSQRCSEMTEGQLHDLRSDQEKSAPKTTALFQAAFSLGWIYGGGALDRLSQVERAAFSFGMAFQTADDLCDNEISKNTGDLALKEHLYNAKEALKTAGLFSIEMVEFFSFFENYCAEASAGASSAAGSKATSGPASILASIS